MGRGWQQARAFILALLVGGSFLPRQAAALERIVFGINWVAEAEYGGFYQALATGAYARRGLAVTIRQGGPQVNHTQLLVAGRIDLGLADNMLLQFNLTARDIPVVAIAAFFQKAPQALLAHPDAGVRSFEDLRDKIILVATEDRLTWWQWLKHLYGLRDEQIRPYTFNPAPFLADKRVVMQAYVTAEPFVIEREAGFRPVVLMLADAGYDTYANILQVRRDFLERHRHEVEAFVEASIEGWYDYLYGDPEPAHELIKQANPDMTDALLAYSRSKLREYGIVDSGDALTLGIGAMTDARWQSFFEKAAEWGLVPAALSLEKAYTLAFVNRGHGLDLKRRLIAR